MHFIVPDKLLDKCGHLTDFRDFCVYAVLVAFLCFFLFPPSEESGEVPFCPLYIVISPDKRINIKV